MSEQITAHVTIGSYWAGWSVRGTTFYQGKTMLGSVYTENIDGLIAALQELKRRRVEAGEQPFFRWS